jgi:oligogalacturonide lyase
MAVNEKSGDIVQVTEGGYSGMLCIARKSMKLYCMRNASADTSLRRNMPMQIIEADLEKIFKDSKAGR